MKKASVVVLLVCGLAVRAAAYGLLPSVEIWGSLSVGALAGGAQKAFLDGSTFSYPPTGYSAIIPIVGVRGYLLGPVGIEASFGIFGKTQVDAQGVNSLTVYDYTLANAGPVLRFTFRTGGASAVAVILGGGANYSFFGFSSDAFATRPNMASDIGWYGKASVAWYVFPGFFLDGTFWYYYMNAKYTDGTPMDGTYYLFAFSFGFGL
ncbi:MAG TPA: hypothetical protein VL354_06340 [Spirochaetia bacterium]|nr:hypothetical protein [Spirochaetia bacterium]